MTKQLMSFTEQRVDCMNFFAAPFFSTILTSMNHSITAGVARLLDKRKKVISFPNLLQIIKTDIRSEEDREKFTKIEAIFKELKRIAEPIVRRRHEIIGHISRIETPTKVLVRDIDSFEKKLDALISEIASAFDFQQGGFNTTWDSWYDSEIGKYGDANTIMEYLEENPLWIAEQNRRSKTSSFLNTTA